MSRDEKLEAVRREANKQGAKITRLLIEACRRPTDAETTHDPGGHA